MPASIFQYALNGDRSLKEFWTTPAADLPAYCRFTIALKARPNEPLHSIITNANGCGRWVYDETDGTYSQRRGTCQYAIPGTSQGIRKALRAELREQLAHKRDFSIDGLTEDEQQVLDVLEGE